METDPSPFLERLPGLQGRAREALALADQDQRAAFDGAARPTAD